jgi:hypothetical protein
LTPDAFAAGEEAGCESIGRQTYYKSERRQAVSKDERIQRGRLLKYEGIDRLPPQRLPLE